VRRLLGFLRPRRKHVGEDPRADELRQKLAESRAIVEERDEFEAAEVTIDRAEPAPEDPELRRRAVHEAGRSVVERMREGS
jgi:hypothetical protein